MDKRRKSIWIDLDNSPHVPLFVPILKHYRNTGVEVLLTARDHSQTIELLDLAGLGGTYAVIGTHAGGSKIHKLTNLMSRGVQLARYVRRRTIPSVAVSHGSRSMVLAARLLRIPVITMYDYEFTETRVFNRFSDRVLVPERIDDRVLDRIGLPARKRHKYPGLKEELYVRDFEPDPNFAETLASSLGRELPADRIIVVLRPPAATANYHDPRSDSIFAALLQYLFTNPEVFTLIVPRTRSQAEEIAQRLKIAVFGCQQLAILQEAVNGLNLLNTADIVISGGGTMNREAVLLGLPVYSIFQGEQGSLDRSMEDSGEIVFIRSVADIARLRLAKRPQGGARKPIGDRVEQFVRKHIDFFLASGPKS